MASPKINPHANPHGVASPMQTRQQRDYLMSGGPYRMVLEHKWDTGELVRPEDYEHQDYPKALNVSLGVREFPHSTEALRGGQLTVLEWVERRKVIADLIVGDEDEEVATLAAVDRAREIGLEIDPDWTAEMLRRLVKQAERDGVPLSQTAAPVAAEAPRAAPASDQATHDRMAELEAKIAALTAAVSVRDNAGKSPAQAKRTRGAAALAASVAAE